DRFDIAEVFALHSGPGDAVGSFFTTPGPIMAAADTIHIHITGVGGHGAYPYETADPVVAAVGIVNAIQTIVSRNHKPYNDLVISITQIHTGSADNIVPEKAYINGTVRTMDKDTQAMVHKRLKEVVAGHAAAYNVQAELVYEYGYPATINDPEKTAFAAAVAREISPLVDDARQYDMGAEDFSYMLEKRPGAYLYVGNGDSAGLHHPAYDFDDGAAPAGASFFA
ncbi:MAG: amidohydrolase, partial [Paracoccaceae bacterium]|nr:amidohydrolase [Paracoccaceae bacterium]